MPIKDEDGTKKARKKISNSSGLLFFVETGLFSDIYIWLQYANNFKLCTLNVRKLKEDKSW